MGGAARNRGQARWQGEFPGHLDYGTRKGAKLSEAVTEYTAFLHVLNKTAC
jgi:hypothetical protein